MNSKPQTWPTVELAVETDAVEIVSTALWEAGVLGIETLTETVEVTHLRAFFQDEAACNSLEPYLSEFLNQFETPSSVVRSLRTYAIADEDWLENWKATYTCLTVGNRWLIVPSWKRAEALANPDFAGRLWIEIDPGMAFGTGTHETTQLCLKLLEVLPPDVRNILDVGTGTGILAIGAAKLFPQASIDACDTDPEALLVAGENLEGNQVSDRVTLREGSVSNFPIQKFDVTVANLTADVIIPLADSLVNLLREGGHLILSGILDTQIEEVKQAVEAAGGIQSEVQALGEWRALYSTVNRNQ